MAAKTKKRSNPKPDVFQKAYDTVTGIVKRSVDILQQKFDDIVHDVQKRVFLFGMMTLAVLFLLFALSEFISALYPWYGKTSGYLTVGFIILIIALFYKKGMD